MKRLIILAAIPLAACTTAQIDQGKAIARASINAVCTSYPTADAVFQGIRATGRLSASIIAREEQAVRALAAICADPPTDTKMAIATAGRVLTELLTVSELARKQAGA